MSPELWRQIEKHYLALQGRPTEEHQRYLAECYPEVRDHVEKMLDQPAGDSFLPHLLDCETPTTPVSLVLKPGFQFGPYRADSFARNRRYGRRVSRRRRPTRPPLAIKVSKEEFSCRFEREVPNRGRMVANLANLANPEVAQFPITVVKTAISETDAPGPGNA